MDLNCNEVLHLKEFNSFSCNFFLWPIKGKLSNTFSAMLTVSRANGSTKRTWNHQNCHLESSQGSWKKKFRGYRLHPHDYSSRTEHIMYLCWYSGRYIRLEHQLSWGRWFDLNDQVCELPLLIHLVLKHLCINLASSMWSANIKIDLHSVFNYIWVGT